MHLFLSMKTSIEYLPVPLKRYPGSTQNEDKTSPALMTTQMSIWDAILVSFEPHFGGKILSKTQFWKPLNKGNDSDIIVALQNKLCCPFVTLL